MFSGNVDLISAKAKHVFCHDFLEVEMIVLLSTYNNISWWMTVVNLKLNTAEIYCSGTWRELINDQVVSEIGCLKKFLAWRANDKKYLNLRIQWIDGIHRHLLPYLNAIQLLRFLGCLIVNRPLPIEDLDVGADNFLLAYHLLKDSDNRVKGILRH